MRVIGTSHFVRPNCRNDAKTAAISDSDYKCTFIDFETTLSGSASGIFVLHLDPEHAFDRASIGAIHKSVKLRNGSDELPLSERRYGVLWDPFQARKVRAIVSGALGALSSLKSEKYNRI